MSPDANVLPFRPAAITVAASSPEMRARNDDVHERARTSGFAAGFAAGARAAAVAADAERTRIAAQHAAAEADRDRAFAEALVTLAQVAEAAQARALPVLDEAVRAVHEGVVVLTEHVLGRELADGDASPRALLARALGAGEPDGPVTVHLHPVDLARVESYVADHPQHALPEQVRLVGDATLAPGDARSVLPTGFVDARVSHALDRARTALLEDLS